MSLTRDELEEVRVTVRSLRNHAKNVVAQLTDLLERLDDELDDPATQEAQGHDHHERHTCSA